MADPDQRAGLVAALLKQWRAQRGLSQLDLALAADVSARHISFIETGRSVPSPEMVLRLGVTLGMPLRQVNAMLVAAGHEPAFEESSELPDAVADAVALLKRHHEPFPLLVIDHTYEVLDANRAALDLMGALLGLPPTTHPVPAEAIATMGLNLAKLTFDPAGAQPHLVNFDEVGRELLWRIQREVLADPDDAELRSVLQSILDLPTVAPDWREVDLTVPSHPAIVLHLRRDALDLRFLTTVTAFQAPQNIGVERLRIEHWLPFDDATVAACHELAAQHRA